MPVRFGVVLEEPVTIADLWDLGPNGVESLPVIGSGQFDNLRFDNGHLRVWSTRQKIADYDGDVSAWAKERYIVERFVGAVGVVGGVGGSWERVGCLCLGCKRPPEAYR
jgi:hypothetical protein